MSVVIADVSHHNTVDYFSGKEIDGVIIRATYGKNGVDKKLTEHVHKAENAGIPYGFYHFNYASTHSGAKENVKHFVEVISQYNPTLPCAIDIENDPTNKTLSTLFNKDSQKLYTEIARIELDILEKAGYFAMLYANTWDLMNIVSDSSLRARYALWVASWTNRKPTNETMKLWQYTSTGNIEGIRGDVDLSQGEDSFLGLVGKMKCADTEDVSRETFNTGDTVTTTADYDVYGTHLAGFIKQINLTILAYKPEVDAYIVSTNGKDVTAVIARDRLRRA